ncbi:MAG: sodium:calcium antiporter [Candidatus Dormibacteria bacterium]
MGSLVSVLAFVAGAIIVVVATERLLEGLVGVARATRLAPFVVSAVLSGLEAENVAVGLAAGADGHGEIALGTAFGGATFLICVALGLGALIAPLRVTLPKGIVALLAAAPVVAGVALAGPTTPRWGGLVLLVAFSGAMAYLVRASRDHRFVEVTEANDEPEEARPIWQWLAITGAGVAAITLGGELVARGATGIISAFGVPALLMGMVVTPAAIEAEEVVRQVIPAKRGFHDIAAGNVIGTVLYFSLFNLGLIALLTPVAVPHLTVTLEWPYLVAVCWLASAMLWRNAVTRINGAILLGLGVVYAALHVVLR